MMAETVFANLELVYPLDLPLFALLLTAVYTDLRYRRVYNLMIAVGLVIAFAVNFLLQGLAGLPFSLLGALAGTALLFIPFAFGGLGAGDVKLLAMVGAFRGAGFALETFLFAALCGGLFSIMVLIYEKRLLAVLKGFFLSLYILAAGGEKPEVATGGLNTTPGQRFTLPYALAIATGCALAMVLDLFG